MSCCDFSFDDPLFTLTNLTDFRSLVLPMNDTFEHSALGRMFNAFDEVQEKARSQESRDEKQTSSEPQPKQLNKLAFNLKHAAVKNCKRGLVALSLCVKTPGIIALCLYWFVQLVVFKIVPFVLGFLLLCQWCLLSSSFIVFTASAEFFAVFTRNGDGLSSTIVGPGHIIKPLSLQALISAVGSSLLWYISFPEHFYSKLSLVAPGCCGCLRCL